MTNATRDDALKYLALMTLSVFFVMANFWWQGHDGFNLWDEGYLWYGAKQIVAGEIPLRDFMAYDPGRYYWSASYFMFSGDTGIISLRISVAAFQVLGLYAGLWTISSALRKGNWYNILYLCIAAVTLMAWAYPRHKIFDISISMIIVAGLTYLLQGPSARRYFLLGAVVGFAAVFGRNHGVYGALASFFAFVWLRAGAPAIRSLWHGVGVWAVGVIVGYVPVLAMCAFVPGYFDAFMDTIVFMLQQGNTNLPLPIPWPWTVGFGTAGVFIEIRWLLIGMCFIALIAFGVGALVWIFNQKLRGRYVRPELVAAVCSGLPYSHYAFARADVGHLAQGIYPLLLGTFIMLAACRSGTIKRLSVLAIAFLSVFILADWQPGVLARTQPGWEKVTVSGSTLSMDPSTAEAVELLRDLTARYAQNGRPVLVLPFWPGAYPLLDRQAPLWEIYALSPRDDEFQRAEIERIKKADPGYVLVFEMPMDGREELRYSNSHPIIDDYIRSHFEMITNSVGGALLTYKSIDAGETQ
ncbi:hypothetical protein [Pseudomonas sp. W5-36]|uniref:hypothetical protein n=1 Tax=Pseudomonas sp. W5-36 TaxID=3097455 RepID=UPI003979C628